MGYWQKILSELEPIETKIRNTPHILFGSEAVHIKEAANAFSILNHAIRELMILEIKGETKPKK
jgi:hypothetical protein